MALCLLRTLLPNWCSQGTFYAPLQCVEATTESNGRNSHTVCPGSHAQGLSHVRNQSVCSHISLLFWSSRPLAVGLFVISVVVDSLNAMRCRRTWTHVLQKRFKRMPPLARRDRASAIAMIGVIAFIAASTKHVGPRSVCRRFIMPMLYGSAIFAARAFLAAQVLSAHYRVCSALALAFPLHSPVSFFRFLNYRPFTKWFPGQVYKISAPPSRIAVSHLNLLHRFKVVRAARRLQSSGCSHYSQYCMEGTGFAG
jgi:hypothetical protein